MCCEVREVQRIIARRQTGDEYEADVTIDLALCAISSHATTTSYRRQPRKNMPWLEEVEVTVPQDGATPDTGIDTAS